MSIKLKGSTDGSVTLQAPADTSPTGSDKTFTLPTQDGTSGQVLQTNGSGALSFVDEGKIVQIVQYQREGSNSSRGSLASPAVGAGFVDLMSKSITTKVSNSKILVMFEYNSYNCTRGEFKLFRGSTQISADPYAHYVPSSSQFVNYKGTLVDDPQQSSGTSITYKVQVRSNSGTCHFGYGDSGGGGATSLVLVEIAP